jgi:hypothetical protein
MHLEAPEAAWSDYMTAHVPRILGCLTDATWGHVRCRLPVQVAVLLQYRLRHTDLISANWARGRL